MGYRDGPGRGRLTTQAASTYKLPSFSEMPEVFNVTLLENATEEGAVYGSKAVGEPPLMLAFSVREALRQAAAAFGPPGTSVDLASPATPEAVYWAVEQARAAHEHGHVARARLGPSHRSPSGARPFRPRVGTSPGRAQPCLTSTGSSRCAACARRGSPACWSRWPLCRSMHRGTPAPRWSSAPPIPGARSAAEMWRPSRSIGRGSLSRMPPRRRSCDRRPVGQGALPARRSVLRRKGHGAARATARSARGGHLRLRARRLGAGADPGPP